MIEVDIQIPPAIKTGELIKTVERTCSNADLFCALKGTLAAYPGCVHWHFRKGRQAGTLEITWWEREHRLWFKVADNRTGTWIKETITQLKQQVEISFR